MAVAAAVLVTALSSPTPVRAQTSYGPLSLQIVAHQDDDFLFMNPDLGNAIASGYPIVTVYLTAGQSVGTSEGITPALDREHFAAARQRGIRAAYAQMAGLPDSWSRSILLPDGIHQVERYVLSGTAQPIHLLFMNLPDGGDTLEPHANALADMWGNAGYVTDTIVPACAFPQPCYFVPVAPMFYDRAGVLAVLRALIDEYQPVHVRSLDPQPFENMPIVSYDNTDHTAAARFASLALAGYHGPYASRRYSLVAYKGYSFLNYPRSLGFADVSEKSSTAATYQPFDPNYDYYQTYHGSYEGYYHVMWERYPGSSTWLERSADGRLVAATVEDRRVQLWHEWIPGSGDWGGPILLPGTTPVSPHLTLLRRGDGRLQVFAMRLPLEREVWGPSPALPLQEIVTAVEIPTVSPAPIRFGPWSVVGSPDAAECAFAACQFAGPQTAAIDGAGRTYVFAKRSDGRIAYTYSSSGGPWAAWNWFGLEDIVDGIAAMTRDDGRIELFATSRSGEIQHLIQGVGSVGFVWDSAFGATFTPPSQRAASAPTITKNADGRPEIFYREQDTGRVLTVYQTGGGAWAGPVLLYGDAGVGPVAAIRRSASGHIQLFERNVWSGISATWQQAPNDVFYLQWAILGGFVAEYPSAASDFLGRAAVAVKGGDGRLYLRRESGAIGSFGPWTPIATQCSNGIDDDGDGHADFPDDPGCRHASAPLEAPECDDGLDNDGDGRIDLGDRQCFARADRSERVDCANGIDDDGDGSVDSADVGCLHSGWPFEDPECSDDVDNDLDTQLDWDGAGLGTGDAACVAPFGVSEVPEPGAGSIASLVAGLALVGRLRSRGRWPAARAGRADT